jgi:glycosyltransferase involved in cell wall biosynthesis
VAPALTSVIVPTRDRPLRLAACLASLAAQSASPDEVIVVDDSTRPDPEVARLVLAAGAKLVRSGGRGPAAARNAGVRAARGEVVCFTDDDCRPDPDWLALLVPEARAGGAAAGRTVAPSAAGAALRASQEITDFLQRRASDPGSPSPGFAPTSNLACTRSLAIRLPFDPRFPRAAGEDRDWSARAAANGAAPAFVPGAVVVHHAELGPAGFLTQQFRYGRGAARFRATSPGAPRVGAPSFYTGLIAAGFRRGAAPGLLVLAAQAAVAAGAAFERIFAGPRPGAGGP